MIVIDTPGLLSAPAKLRHMNEQQRQLQQAAKEAEHLVLEKMKCQDYLILCVEVRVPTILVWSASQRHASMRARHVTRACTDSPQFQTTK